MFGIKKVQKELHSLKLNMACNASEVSVNHKLLIQLCVEMREIHQKLSQLEKPEEKPQQPKKKAPKKSRK